MTENVKLAFLADGRSVHTVRWLRYFERKGYDVHLITFTSKPIKGVKIHTLRYFGKRAYPLRIWETRRAVKKIDPDILHAHYISHYGIYAALTGFHPLILSAWGSDISTDPQTSRITDLLVRFALKKADLVHTADDFGKKRLMELGCDAEKIFVHRWGVDTKKFSPNAKNQPLKRKLRINHVYSVLCARWWKPQYRVDVLIRAIPLVLKKIPDVKFILLGGGPLEFTLKKLATKLGVYENVVFVGKVPEKEMPKYLASVDTYVDTISQHRIDAFGDIIVARGGGGGIGQTTRGAMACGTPQIVSDKPELRSGDLFQGLTYKPLDHRDLAEKIVHLLRDEKLRKRIGEESRKVALVIFDLEKTMKKWKTVYDELKGSAKLENTAKSFFQFVAFSFLSLIYLIQIVTVC